MKRKSNFQPEIEMKVRNLSHENLGLNHSSLIYQIYGFDKPLNPSDLRVLISEMGLIRIYFAEK